MGKKRDTSSDPINFIVGVDKADQYAVKVPWLVFQSLKGIGFLPRQSDMVKKLDFDHNKVAEWCRNLHRLDYDLAYWHGIVPAAQSNPPF
jgi:hypothetical protein